MTLQVGFLYALFFIAVISLLDYNLELRSSSLTLTSSLFVATRPSKQARRLSLLQTFGNVSELSFLSLNRDLFTIVDIQAGLARLSTKFHAVEGECSATL